MARKSNTLVEQGQQSANPATPASGYTIFYPKTDGKWYFKNPDGTVFEVMTGNKAIVVLTDSATVAWNFALGYTAQVTLGGNRTLSLSNIAAGDYGAIYVIQDGTGNRTLTLPSGSKVVDSGAGVITLSNTAGAIDLLTFHYNGTNYFWNYGKKYT